MWLGVVGLLYGYRGIIKVKAPIHIMVISARVFDTRSIGEVVLDLVGHKDHQRRQSFREIELEIKNPYGLLPKVRFDHNHFSGRNTA